ncbi:MAG TPA: carboxypeptidase regulatory-like domain-containing protein [Terriglobales bacterium]|nr:carboxypeptidase regulatory-like domain-containing protein [Terriglobales bacterium]
MSRRFRSVFLSLLAASLIAPMLSFAQTSRGMIAGTVTDTTGAAIPGASVTAVNKDNGLKRSVVTGPTGAYRMDAMDLGAYTITVSSNGFDTLTLDNVAVRGSVITPADATLRVGVKSESVTVEATNNGVETQTAAITHTISNKEVTSLPIQNFNPISLATTLPGVADVNETGRNFANGTGFSVNGLNTRSNNFLIDGQDNNDNGVQGQAFQPINPNAIQEVSVLTNSYSAEFGRGGASVTNVIYKSGSNNFHGSVWDNYSGSGLNSVDAQSGLAGATSNDKARYDTHTFGFAVGGPVVKNKLFFFFTPEWQRFYGNSTPAVIAAPTALGASQLQAYGSANANLLLQYFGNLRASGNTFNVNTQSNGAGQNIEFGLVQRTPPPQQQPDTQYSFKVDYVASERNVIAVRYLHDYNKVSPDFYNNPTSLPGFDTNQGGPSQNIGGSWTHTFTPNAVNEFRSSYGKFDFEFAPEPDSLKNPLYTEPRITINGISRLSLLGVAPIVPQGRGHQTYQEQDAFTYTRGNHTWKLGADVAHLLVNDHIPFNYFGTETYNAGGGFTPFGNFLDDFTGLGTFGAISFGSPVAAPKMTQQGYFLEDTWKARPNLTLSLGLRYEYAGNPENYEAYPAFNLANGPFNNLTDKVMVKNDTNNFGPRIGVTYSPNFLPGILGEKKTVFRGGFGVFYDSFYTLMLDNVQASAPNAVADSIVGTSGRGLANASTLIAQQSPVLNPLAGQTSVASDLQNPKIYQWNLDVQRELPASMIMTLAYVGTRGEHLFESDTINAFAGYDPNALGSGALAYLPRLNPARGPITVRDNSGDSHYNGLSAEVERHFARGLLFRSAYTFSKAIDNGSDVYYGLGTFTVVPQSPYFPDGRKGERALSAFDSRHRWVTSFVYSVPGYNSNSNQFTHALSLLSNGWEFANVLSLQSGEPATISVAGIDTNGDGNTANGRPFLGNVTAPITSVGIDGIFVGGTPGTIYNNDTGAPTTASNVHWIVAPGVGNVGRNTYIQPGSYNLNTAVTRTIRMPKWEGQELRLRAEFYNVLNHANYDYTPGIDMNVLDGTGSFLNLQQGRQGQRVVKGVLQYTF